MSLEEAVRLSFVAVLGEVAKCEAKFSFPRKLGGGCRDQLSPPQCFLCLKSGSSSEPSALLIWPQHSFSFCDECGACLRQGAASRRARGLFGDESPGDGNSGAFMIIFRYICLK